MPVTMTRVWFDGDERHGLEADLLIDDRQHRVRLVDVTITDDASEAAAKLMAAFRRWWLPQQ
jgi:hypothetical protein